LDRRNINTLKETLLAADHGDAMEIAIHEGQEGVVRILIKHGAVCQSAEEV